VARRPSKLASRRKQFAYDFPLLFIQIARVRLEEREYYDWIFLNDPEWQEFRA
jgi:hypothetical protein